MPTDTGLDEIALENLQAANSNLRKDDDRDAPRHPKWKVTVKEFGVTRETVMTEQEYNAWRINRWKVTS